MKRVAAAVLLILVCAYGAVLRLNVLTSRYGVVAQPAWARVLTARVAPIARSLEPRPYAWAPVAHPYVGGDPASYLKFAREMRSFYQGHVREPMFLAITRGWLWLLHGRDVGISFASASMSTLVIFATFLLGRAAFSTPVGLAAALAAAADYDLVSWAPDGWRDDTFTAFFVLGAWALVRLRDEPAPRRAAVAGVAGAAACLTRITSISWFGPALVAVPLCSPRGDRAPRWQAAAIGAAIAAVLVAPYLVNCARVFGDPLIAINVHTGYYRHGEGIDPSAPLSARSYIGQKILTSPIRQLDTAVTGVFVLPLQNKFGGFNFWAPHAGDMLRALAIAGLLLWLFTGTGRLLTVIWVTALLPYAFTWNIADGQAWRFTMHVYPLFLVAAFGAVQQVALVAASLRRDGWRRRPVIPYVAGTLTLTALGFAAYGAYMALPYYVSAEAVAHGEEVTISTGDRDSWIFTTGWSAAAVDGMVTSRVVLSERATMWLPLRERRPYRLTLRMEPVCADAPRQATVLVSGQIVGRFGLALDTNRVGSYDVEIPAPLARDDTKVQLVADRAVPAGRCGPKYAYLPADAPVSLRLWYVRIHPS